MDRKQETKDKQNSKASAPALNESIGNEVSESIQPPALEIQAENLNTQKEELAESDFEQEEQEESNVFDIAPPLPPIIRKKTRMAAEGKLGTRNIVPYQLKLPFTSDLENEQNQLIDKYILNSK